MTWLLSAASLAGTVLNIRRERACFAVWFATNCAWCVADVAYGLYARAPLDAIYAGLAVWGWRRWGRA